MGLFLRPRRPLLRVAAGAATAHLASGLQDLERLVALHDAGSLTDAEFAAAKASLLGR